ncbi:MAG: ATPase, T2SS/T4P/T4SS family [Candidatus Buchananbacteria bacterium]
MSVKNNFTAVTPALTKADQSIEALVSGQKILEVIIKNALDGRATDIHIEPSAGEVRIRYRVDGILHSSLTLSATVLVSLLQALRQLVGLPPAKDLQPQAASYKLEYEGKIYNVLVYFLPMIEGEKVVLHLVSAYDQPQTLVELGFADYHLSQIEKKLTRGGLFLVTGKVNSGKTTTLYTLLNILNSEAVNITTLEEPIERYLSGVNQISLGSLHDSNLNEALQVALKQEPDILLLDTLDSVTAVELAGWVATFNKKVFSSLATSDVLSTVKRLLEMGLPTFLLTEALGLIISQRLVRKICPDCRVETTPAPGLLKIAKALVKSTPTGLIDPENLVFYRGAGCPHCSQTGYKGRMVLAEIFELNEPLKNYLIEGGELTAESLTKLDPEFIFLAVDGIIKASQGLTTLEEVIKNIS